MNRYLSFFKARATAACMACGAVMAVAGLPRAAWANYSENFDSGSATFTANDPYWLDPNAANGFITQTTNNPAIWPGFPAGFGTDINKDVSGRGYFLFDGTFTYPGGGSIPVGNDQFFISPTFSVNPNTNYLVSFELTNADTNGVNLASIQPEIGGSLLGFPVSAIGNWTTNGWQSFGYLWNSGSNTSASLILHDFAPSTSGNDFGIDEISVASVPEPATAGLLMLGASGLLIRRRGVGGKPAKRGT
jgi:hypothetical protein